MDTAATLTPYEIERNKPMPSKLHSYVQSVLNGKLWALFHERYNFHSELGLNLEGWQSTPDLCIFPKEKIDFAKDIPKVKESPLGIIEILSASQNPGDLVAKAYQYFENGVKSCWLVIPGLKNIYVFRDPENYEIFKSTELLVDKKLDIELPLADIFS